MNPQRSCILCRKRKEKSDLFRIVSDNFKAFFDNTQKMSRRGIYICKDKKCIDGCLKKIEKNKIKVGIKIDNESFKEVLEGLKNELEEM